MVASMSRCTFALAPLRAAPCVAPRPSALRHSTTLLRCVALYRFAPPRAAQRRSAPSAPQLWTAPSGS
eukprot:4581804-Alexandrium_andersonii.AAC.1